MHARGQTGPLRRLLGQVARLAVMAILAVTSLITFSATPALASGEGQNPDLDRACSSNARTGSPLSIYDTFGAYWGWVEMRIGTSGSCWGYQWTQLWIQRRMTIIRTDGSGQADAMRLVQAKQKNPLGGLWTTRNAAGIGNIEPGRYVSNVLYAPFNYDIPVCGEFDNPAWSWGVVSQKDGAWGLAYPFFGTGGVKRNLCA